MSNLKDALKAAGLVGSFGQVIKTGSVEEKCETCTSCQTAKTTGGCTSCKNGNIYGT